MSKGCNLPHYASPFQSRSLENQGSLAFAGCACFILKADLPDFFGLAALRLVESRHT